MCIVGGRDANVDATESLLRMSAACCLLSTDLDVMGNHFMGENPQ
jgi:hypothetical protein